MFIKSRAIITEFFNIEKAQKNSGPQEMFSKSGCLVYPLTLFRASTVVSCIGPMNLVRCVTITSCQSIGHGFVKIKENKYF